MTDPAAIHVSDPDALFALAHAMEAEAARRYRELAAAMRSLGKDEVAAVFDRLAGEEGEHARQIDRWAERELGHPPAEVELAWQSAEVFALDEEALDEAYGLTPYRALSIAVHNEERAFAFYSYLAAEAADPALRAYAEGLAREELEHAALLRRHRRAAYHAEREGPPRDRWNLRRLAPATRDELAAIAAALDAGLAEAHGALAAPAAAPAEPPPARAELTRCLLDLEEIYDFYLRVAESTAREEAAMTLAQALAERLIARIARLRAALAAAG